jgi:16S rRNA (guanine(966)-N(2))-methyltransferase RsmD
MRIIAGEARGRRLRPVRGLEVRPTSDRVRESLFSILESRLPGDGLSGSRVLDLFAGTGALGIEALSRGAREATFVESDPEAARTVRENLAHCRLQHRGRVLVQPVEEYVAAPGRGESAYDLVFADPPYTCGREAPWLEALVPPLLSAAAVVVVEHAGRTVMPETAGRLARFDQRRYGQTALTFYRPAAT